MLMRYTTTCTSPVFVQFLPVKDSFLLRIILLAMALSNCQLKLFHALVLLETLFGAIYFYLYIPAPANLADSGRAARGEPVNEGYGGKFKFLTFLDMIIQASYFTIALLNDFVGSNDVSPKRTPLIRKIKDYVLATFAWPIAINVASTFWALYAIDRELVFPKVLDAFFPSWLNHVLHTNIAIFIVLEMCVSFRKYPSRKAGLLGLSLFMVAYLVWIHVIYYVSGVWVYPVLEVLALPQRLVFFIAMLVFSVILYRSGEFVNSVIWVKELKQLKTRKAA